MMRTLDEILEQAFTDGASDTMWQNDRHVEIFATAKAELEEFINQQVHEARKEELTRLKEYNGAYIGIDGLRVDNMIAHEIIDERLAELNKEQSNATKS